MQAALTYLLYGLAEGYSDQQVKSFWPPDSQGVEIESFPSLCFCLLQEPR